MMGSATVIKLSLAIRRVRFRFWVTFGVLGGAIVILLYLLVGHVTQGGSSRMLSGISLDQVEERITALFPDDTVYAPGFSESKFRSIRIGMPQAEMMRILGEPLRVDPSPGFIYWTYGPREFENPPSYIPSTTTIRADLAGKIEAIFGDYLDTRKDELIGHTLDEARNRFGEPLHVLTVPTRNLYWYSKMKGIKGHYVRLIAINVDGGVGAITASRIGYYVGGSE